MLGFKQEELDPFEKSGIPGNPARASAVILTREDMKSAGKAIITKPKFRLFHKPRKTT